MSAAAKWAYLKERRYKSMYPPTNKDVLKAMRAAGWPGANQGVCEQSEFVVWRSGDRPALRMNGWGSSWWPTVREAFDFHVKEELHGAAPDLSQLERDESSDDERAGWRGRKRPRGDGGEEEQDSTALSIAATQKVLNAQPRKMKASLAAAKDISSEHGFAANAKARALLNSTAGADDLDGFFTDSDDDAPVAASSRGRMNSPVVGVKAERVGDDASADKAGTSPSPSDSGSEGPSGRWGDDPLDAWGREACITTDDSFSFCDTEMAEKNRYFISDEGAELFSDVTDEACPKEYAGVFRSEVDTLEVLRADLLVIWGTAGETRLPRLPAAIVRRLFVATRYLPNVYLQELAARCIQRIYAMGFDGWFPSLEDVKDCVLLFGAPKGALADYITNDLLVPAPLSAPPSATSAVRSARAVEPSPGGTAAKNKIKGRPKKSKSSLCFYCKDPSSLLEKHPYVVGDFKGGAIMLCPLCMKNWKGFRQEAKSQGRLQLPGDENEEICSLCSHSPSKVTMCSFCPRSFCKCCLKKVLTQNEFKIVTKPGDWKCMHCINTCSGEDAALAASTQPVACSRRPRESWQTPPLSWLHALYCIYSKRPGSYSGESDARQLPEAAFLKYLLILSTLRSVKSSEEVLSALRAAIEVLFVWMLQAPEASTCLFVEISSGRMFGIRPLLSVLEVVPCTSVIFDRMFRTVIAPALVSGSETNEGSCMLKESALNDDFTAWPKLFSSIMQRRLAEDRWKVKEEVVKFLLQLKILTAFWHRHLDRLGDSVISEICKQFIDAKSKMRGVFGELVLQIDGLLDGALERVREKQPYMNEVAHRLSV